jgi:hypothetical protein
MYWRSMPLSLNAGCDANLPNDAWSIALYIQTFIVADFAEQSIESTVIPTANPPMAHVCNPIVSTGGAARKGGINLAALLATYGMKCFLQVSGSVPGGLSKLRT